MEQDCYEPFSKENNVIKYVHHSSNHPQIILKRIPEITNNRLSRLSSNEELFMKNKDVYQRALDEAGYRYNLQYDNRANNETRRKNKRNILYFNPPYCMSVKTNIGREFLNLLDKHFGINSKLHTIINRSKVKISYSCNTNIARLIQNHNSKVLNKNIMTAKEKED